ncbi:MAG TPA: hypothetical protein VGK40_02085 [Verrucomicrobiae bacterium]
MARGFIKMAVALALVLAIGGHWAVLQTAAWVGMVISYSQDSPLKEAVVKTFDGRHPCKLCKAVQAGKTSRTEARQLERRNQTGFLARSQRIPARRASTVCRPPRRT